MTPEQIEQERAAFEAWILKEYDGKENAIKRCDEGYSVYQVNDKWKGWLARAEQTGWISVEDRLPEINTYVLAATHRGLVIIDRLCDYGRGKEWVSGHSDNPITHWQPLPQPPAGDPA